MQSAPIPPPTGDVTPVAPLPQNSLLRIAQAQRLALVALGVSLLGTPLELYLNNLSDKDYENPILLPVILAASAAALAIAGFRIWTTYKLAKSLNVKWAWLAGLLALLGCIGLAVLYSLNQQAVARLTKGGIRAGFFGVGSREMLRLAEMEKAKSQPTPPISMENQGA